jgi:hypothetical protein
MFIELHLQANFAYIMPSYPAIMRRQSSSLQERLWSGPVHTDGHQRQKRNVLERRERDSAKVFVRGRKWYAQNLLRTLSSPNSRAASRQLIENSRRLIEESRRIIAQGKNNLAFTRSVDRFLN